MSDTQEVIEAIAEYINGIIPSASWLVRFRPEYVDLNKRTNGHEYEYGRIMLGSWVLSHASFPAYMRHGTALNAHNISHCIVVNPAEPTALQQITEYVETLVLLVDSLDAIHYDR